jgi:hypothetical protein
MSEEVRAEINSFLGRPVVRKLRVRHVPTLVLEDGNSQLEAGSQRPQTRDSDIAGAPSKPALELANLDPEVARIVEDAFAKYFCTATNPRLARRER